MTKREKIAVLVAVSWVVAACAKVPASEIEAAKKAVETARAAGSSEYLPTLDKDVADKLNAALDEIKKQESKVMFFRNYDQAKKMLKGVDQDAQALQAATSAKKEEVKKEALSLQAAATEAIQKAKGLLALAPSGKGTGADIAALKGDVAGLEGSLPAVQKAADAGDYLGALAKAKAVKEKADAVSGQVQQAIEKVKAAKGTKGKGKKVRT